MNEALKKTLFVDIETVARVNTYNDLDTEWKELWDKQCKQSYRDLLTSGETYETLWKLKAGIHPEFGTIACIVMGYLAEADGKVTLRVKPIFGQTEAEMLKSFTAIADKFQRMCAYNGRKFDFPYLARRSLINSLPIANALNTMGKKPWENENIDPMELWQFGHLSFPSMDLLCKLLNIPLKSIMHGSDVHDVYYGTEDGRFQNIARYCAADVIALVKLLLKITSSDVEISDVVLA